MTVLTSSLLGFARPLMPVARSVSPAAPSLARRLRCVSAVWRPRLPRPPRRRLQAAARRKRILSGVQPTGSLHLGNYLGAIRQWVANQDEYDNYFCVVDLHAITAPHNPKQLELDSYRTAALYLAAGLDPARSRIFIQSHVREHSELAWLLNCATPMG